jgi:tetratricopeptide (TPR) repeat protein
MKNTKKIGLYVVWLAAAAMLVYAVIEKHPYSYYTLLRWVCCAVFAYSAVTAFQIDRVAWTWIFGGLAGLYNPVFRVQLDRDTWVVVIGAITVAALNLFKKTPSSSPEDEKWLRGYNALEGGKKHYIEERTEQALDCFDTAIECGHGDAEAFSCRGSCLQILEWHLDAIDDFTRAIELEPDDSNDYYMRSISRGAVGDLQGQVDDLNEAIRVAGIPNAANRSHNEHAKEHGYRNGIVGKYQMDLIGANLRIESQNSEERLRKGHPVSISVLTSQPALVLRRVGEYANERNA